MEPYTVALTIGYRAACLAKPAARHIGNDLHTRDPARE